MNFDDIENIWSILESSEHPKSSKLLLRKIDISGFHLGYNIENRNRVIVLELEAKLTKQILKNDPNWKGIAFEEFKLDSKRNAICLSLINHEFSSIFDSFVIDLFENLKTSRNIIELGILFLNRLEKWKNFFKNFGLSKLSRNAQVGLFGELHFLNKYLLKKYSSTDSLEYWRGHDRKYQDYKFPNGNIEVKTTTSKQHIKVFISSEKQLDRTGINNLFLYCAILNDSVSSGFTLKELVDICYLTLKYNQVALSKFSDYLINAGYLRKDDSFYNNEKYYVSQEFMYEVLDGFPSIVTAPNGVGDVNYSIMLSACEDYKTNIDDTLQILMKY